MKKYIIFMLLILAWPIFSQNSPLPQGYRSITIGSTLEEVKELLENDAYFNYRGDPDVSMLLADNQSLIECEGARHIDRAFFQFYNEKLYTITLLLDRSEVDYHSIFRHFSEKYGKHDKLSPDRVVWESSEIRLTIEKPLTIKYIGLNQYSELVEQDTTEKAIQEQLLEEFINEF